MRAKPILAGLACAAAHVLVPSSFAADLGGNCCADLEQRIAELEASTGRPGNRILTLVGVSGGQPRYVAVDPTSFALEDNALRFIGASLSGLLNSALNGTIQNAPLAPAGQMNLGATPSGDGILGTPPSASPAIWASSLGGYAEIDDSELSLSENRFGGGAGGAHFRLAPGVVAGAFAAGATNRLETERGKTIDADYIIAGLYGRAVWGNTFLDTALTAGHSQSESRRQIVTVSAGSTAFETARADYDGAFVLPSVRFGTSIALGCGAAFVPEAEARYIWQHLDDHSETGSSVNLTIGDRDLHSFEERLSLGVRQSLALNAGRTLTWHARAGVVLYQRAGDRDVEAGLFGSQTLFDPGGPDSEAGAFASAGFDLQLTPSLSAFSDGEVMRTGETESIAGSAGVKLSF